MLKRSVFAKGFAHREISLDSVVKKVYLAGAGRGDCNDRDARPPQQ